jgi:hypothetical protein
MFFGPESLKDVKKILFPASQPSLPLSLITTQIAEPPPLPHTSTMTILFSILIITGQGVDGSGGTLLS